MKTNLLILALAATSLGAQPPAPPVDAVKTYLGLSDTQIQALGQLARTEMTDGQPARNQLHQSEDSLRQQLMAGSTDAHALGTALLQIQALRKQLYDAHETYQTQALQLLSAEQKAKLAALAAAAKLVPAIEQAGGLNLLDRPDPPAPGPGPGPARRGPGGPPPPGE